MYEFTISRKVDAPGDVVWDVISDVEAYADYAPNLSSAQLISGEGLNAARRCHDTQGRGWNEICVLWDERKAYGFEVDTSNYPYPFRVMRGTWGMDESDDSVTITMRFEFLPKPPSVFGWLLVRSMLPTFQKICEKLMDNWEREIRERVSASSSAA